MRLPLPIGRRDATDQPIVYRREHVAYDRLVRGWPKPLRPVRAVLPPQLQRQAPPAIARRGSWVVIASIAGRPIGYSWTVPLVASESAAYIEEVAVLARHQGRGVGGQLVIEAAEWMRELGCTRISLLPLGGDGWVTRVGFSRREARTYVLDLNEPPRRVR